MADATKKSETAKNRTKAKKQPPKVVVSKNITPHEAAQWLADEFRKKLNGG